MDEQRDYTAHDEDVVECNVIQLSLVFAQKLREMTEAAVADELTALREENATLRQYRDRKEEMEREYAAKVAELEKAKQDALQEARRKRFFDLAKEFTPVAWGVTFDLIKPPKCDKCDENRQIHFPSPSGNIYMEDCPYCGQRAATPHHRPEEMRVNAGYVESEGESEALEAVWWSWEDNGWNEDAHARYFDSFSDDAPFEKIADNCYGVIFKSRSRCAAFCDWLNERRTEKAAH